MKTTDVNSFTPWTGPCHFYLFSCTDCWIFCLARMFLAYPENEASYRAAIPSRLITAKRLSVCSCCKLQIESWSHQSAFPPYIQNTEIPCPEENLIPAGSQTEGTTWCFSDVSPPHCRKAPCFSTSHCRWHTTPMWDVCLFLSLSFTAFCLFLDWWPWAASPHTSPLFPQLSLYSITPSHALELWGSK